MANRRRGVASRIWRGPFFIEHAAHRPTQARDPEYTNMGLALSPMGVADPSRRRETANEPTRPRKLWRVESKMSAEHRAPSAEGPRNGRLTRQQGAEQRGSA